MAPSTERMCGTGRCGPGTLEDTPFAANQNKKRERDEFFSLRWGPGRRIRGFTHFLSAPGAFTPQNSTNSATFFLSIFHPCVCILSLIVTTVKLFSHPRPTAWSKRKWRRHQTGKREREQSHRSLLLVAKMCALFAAAAAS